MPSTQRSGRYLALRRPRIRRRGGRRAIVDVTASAWPPRPSAARNTKPPSPPSRRPMRSWTVASARSTRTTPGACRIASRSTKSTSSLPRRAHSRPTLAESSGGAMTLAGAVTNDKSQIAAGGALVVQGPDIENIGAHGRRTVALEGTSTHTKPSGSNQRRRSWETEAFKRTVSDDPMEVPVGTAGGIPPCRSAARRPAPPASPRPAPSWWPASACPAASWCAPSPTRPAFPTASSSPSTTGRTRPISSPTALHGPAALRVQRLPVRPAAPVRRHAGAPTNSVGAGGTLAGSRLGSWDALIPPGAKFLTPSGQPKRLGDGFYEQKAVSDQILATTGQRFLEKYSDNDTQYKALLAAGASSRRTTASSSASR